MTLICHPDTPSGAVTAIEVAATRPTPVTLSLQYRLSGAIDALVIPPPEPGARRDGLWRTTCFEAFVAQPDAMRYDELNLAPSGSWAAYHFSDYRDGMRIADDIGRPRIDHCPCEDGFIVRAQATLDGRGKDQWLIGIAAVIEEKAGQKSYWALAHPPGAPDFHHRDCFRLELPAA